MDYFHGERGWWESIIASRDYMMSAWCPWRFVCMAIGSGAQLLLHEMICASPHCGMHIWNGNMRPGPCFIKWRCKVYWSVWKMFNDGWRITGKCKFWNLSFQNCWESKLSRQYIVWEIPSAKMAQKLLNRLYYRPKNSIVCVCCFTICAVTTQHVTRKIWE